MVFPPGDNNPIDIYPVKHPLDGTEMLEIWNEGTTKLYGVVDDIVTLATLASGNQVSVDAGVGVASPSGGRTAQLHRPPCVPRSGQRLGGLTAHRAPLGATRRTCTGLGSRTSGSGCSPRLGGERQVRVSPS